MWLIFSLTWQWFSSNLIRSSILLHIALSMSSWGMSPTTLMGEQVNVLTWVGELAHLNKTKSLKIFHAMSWNVPSIFIFHMANFKWHGRIFHDMSWNILSIFIFHIANFKWHGKIFHDMSSNNMPCHQNMFWNQQSLLTLNMGLANRVIEGSLMWRLEDKNK